MKTLRTLATVMLFCLPMTLYPDSAPPRLDVEWLKTIGQPSQQGGK
jgi:hypothetical protein